jgi:hypothetical protein
VHQNYVVLFQCGIRSARAHSDRYVSSCQAGRR